MPLQGGQTIGRYHIIEPLGKGGMAVVYKAFDTHLECEVAVKVIRVDNLPRNAEERALKRFEREAKAVARLNHPNIVKVTDYGEEDGKPYLVMPYLPGGTLKEMIKERGQIPWQEAARILIPIAEALAYAHSQGVIHRDIKPSNILLTSTGQPMLTDFGVAKIIEDEATQDLTGTSATVGTPEYMAPEQITSKSVDARADLYSLGVVFYEMVTGRRPFEADTPMAVLFKHASDPLPNPSQFVSNLPQIVEQFLYKTLSKKPSERYQTANETSEALSDLLFFNNRSKNNKKKEENHHSQEIEKVLKKPLRTILFITLPSVLIIAGIVVILLVIRDESINGTPVKTDTPGTTQSTNNLEGEILQSATVYQEETPEITLTITPDYFQTFAQSLTVPVTSTYSYTETMTPTVKVITPVKTSIIEETLPIYNVTINNVQSYEVDLYINGQFITKINAYDKTVQPLTKGSWKFSCCKTWEKCNTGESIDIFSNRFISCRVE